MTSRVYMCTVTHNVPLFEKESCCVTTFRRPTSSFVATNCCHKNTQKFTVFTAVRLNRWSSSLNPLKSQWLLYVPPGLTLSNSQFCPRSVCVCVFCADLRTAIISLYSINWMVCITETECLLRGTDWVFIYNSTFCPHSVFVFCVDLRTNSDYFPIQH